MTGRFRRSLVRASAALLLLAVIAGLPAALVIFVGWPLPSALPTGDGFAGWINAPVSDATIVNLLAIAAWLLWAAFVQAIGAEARAAWRGMPTRATTRRTVNPMRMAAATLITALTLGTLLTGAAAASPAPAQASTAVTQVVKVPAPAVVRRGPATIHVGTGSYSYVVERGDTLSKISKEWLGDADRWPEICDLNWHRHWLKVGGTLRDCNLIYPGWDLKLPADATPPDAATPVPSASPPAQTQPDPEPEPTDQPTPTPSARTAIPDDPDGVIEPPTTTPPSTGPATGVPAPAATGQPSVASTATATTRPQASHAPEAEPSPSADDTGVSLPDGSFVTWSLAVAITAAAALVWLQRRRRYVPGDEDDDPSELPPPVAELQRQVARRPELPVHSDLAERAAAVPVLPLLPAGGVGLCGDGAHAAARAALISVLASGGPRDPDRRGEVVIDGTTLTTLIGADAAALGPWPRLHVADDLDHALTIVESRLLHRSRILDEHSLTDLDSLRERAPDEEPLPPVLLICETPPPGARMRARVSLGLGAGLHVSALLLGEWGHGSTIDVAADGRTRLVNGPPVDAVGERMAVLATSAAVAILATLREAHTGEPPTIVIHTMRTTENSRPLPAPPTRHDAEDQPSATAGPFPLAPDGAEQPKAWLRVFGMPRVEDITLPGRPLRGKATEMAVYLACHPDGADTRQIGEHLEPDARVRQADQRVHTNASNLRHVLGRAGGPRKTGYVVKTAGRYRLDPTTVEVDLWQLRDLLTRAAIASAPTRTQMLRDACALYTAPLAEGCDYEWIEPHREKARRWGTEAHLLLADDLLTSDPQAASDLLDKAIGLDRYNEELYRKAMHARHALHDTDGIHTLMRAAAKALADLDAAPAQATIDLAGELRASLDKR